MNSPRPQVVRGGWMVSLLAVLGVLGGAPSSSAQVTTHFFFSVDNTESMQGHTILREEVWNFDTDLSPGSEVYGPLAQTGPAMFTGGGQINAFTVRNGVYYLSTANPSVFADNGLSIDKDDIVRYDPNAAAGSRASLYYDVDLHGSDANVNALSFHSDGDLLVSFDADETFAGLLVLDGDILKFDLADPVGTRSIFFSEATFLSGNEDITGFEFVSDTEMYLFNDSAAQLPGSPLYNPADVVLWDGASGSIAIPEAEFGATGGFILDALGAVPEPSLALLLATALGTALARRRPRPQ